MLRRKAFSLALKMLLFAPVEVAQPKKEWRSWFGYVGGGYEN